MASDFRGCRPCLPCLSGLPHRTAWPLCGEATQRLCGSHTGCVAATQGLLLCHNSTLWLLRSHNSCVGCLNKLHNEARMAGKHRIWHERGREGSVRAETLCGESCAPQDASRMLRLPKNLKIRQKTGVLAIFGPRASSGPISPWMRCAAGWCEAQFTLVRYPGCLSNGHSPR